MIGRVRPPSRALSLLAGGWLGSVLVLGMGVRYLGYRDESVAVRGALLAGLLWPLLLYVLRRDFRKTLPGLLAHKRFVLVSYLYVGALLVSLVNSPAPLVSAAYVGVISMTMVLAASFNLTLTDEDVARGLRFYGVAAGLSLAAYRLTAEFDYWGRLIGFMSPNSVGLVAVSGILASLLGGRMWSVALGAVPCLGLLYLTNSRTAILAVVLGAVAWALAKSKRMNYLRLGIGMVALEAVGLLVYLKWEDLYRFTSALFAVENPYRGMYSGLTGRVDAWREAWEMFVANPVVGVGYHMHERLMAEYSSAHNGYLTALAETGVLGALPVIWLIARAVKTYTVAPRSDFHAWSLGFLCAYLAVAVGERYLLNTGNPTSLIFLLLIVRGFLAAGSPAAVKGEMAPARPGVAGLRSGAPHPRGSGKVRVAPC